MPAGPSTKPPYQRTLTLLAMLALLACAATVQSAESGAIEDRDWLADAGIAVTVDNGVVTLSGTVPGVFEKALAGTTAAAGSGVAGVGNDLFWSPSAESDQVSIEVDSWFERSVAEENAYAGGAVIVDNDLRVRYGPDYYSPDE